MNIKKHGFFNFPLGKNKKLILVLVLFALSLFFCSSVYGWGAYTHTYIAQDVIQNARNKIQEINSKYGTNFNLDTESYLAGAIAPDMGWRPIATVGAEYHSLDYADRLYYNSVFNKSSYAISFALGWRTHVVSDIDFETKSRTRNNVNLNSAGTEGLGNCLRIDCDALIMNKYNPQIGSIYNPLIQHPEIEFLMQKSFANPSYNVKIYYSASTYDWAITYTISPCISARNNNIADVKLYNLNKYGLSYKFSIDNCNYWTQFPTPIRCEEWSTENLKEGDELIESAYDYYKLSSITAAGFSIASLPVPQQTCSDGTPSGQCLRGIDGSCRGTFLSECNAKDASLCNNAYTYYVQDNAYIQCMWNTVYNFCQWSGKCGNGINLAPKYCDNGVIVDNCQKCGCPSGQTCQSDGSCKVLTCSDGTPSGQCSIIGGSCGGRLYRLCTDVLTPSQCQKAYEYYATDKKYIQCMWNSVYNFCQWSGECQLGSSQPQYCNNGNLVYDCSMCGCPAGKVCNTNNGMCETACINECSTNGARQCSGSNAYQICGNYDTDPCLEWSSTTNCPSGQTCQNGQCVQSCTPATCSSLGKQCGTWPNGCGGNINCGSCPSGQTCNANGQCVCINDCSPSGSRVCTGTNSYKTCGNYDTDHCLEWSTSTSCPSGKICKDGQCVTPCPDICHPYAPNTKLTNGYSPAPTNCPGRIVNGCCYTKTNCPNGQTCKNNACTAVSICTDMKVTGPKYSEGTCALGNRCVGRLRLLGNYGLNCASGQICYAIDQCFFSGCTTCSRTCSGGACR